MKQDEFYIFKCQYLFRSWRNKIPENAQNLNNYLKSHILGIKK